MRRIIFLDIDGVLLVSGKFIDRSIVEKLNNLEAEVVVISSWGYNNGNTEKTLRTLGLTLPISGYPDHFYSDLICRGCEVRHWINENIKEDELYEYVILDDTLGDYLLEQEPFLVPVNPQTGLTAEDIIITAEILGLSEYGTKTQGELNLLTRKYRACKNVLYDIQEIIENKAKELLQELKKISGWESMIKECKWHYDKFPDEFFDWCSISHSPGKIKWTKSYSGDPDSYTVLTIDLTKTLEENVLLSH